MLVKKDSPLLTWLLEAFPDMSRSRVKQLLRQGRILVNGKSIRQHDALLRVGDTVEIGAASVEANRISNHYLRLVYEDNHLVVIDKREGILSMATSHHSFCVKTVLDEYFERRHLRCSAHLVHRLDRDTSGLMIFAKSRNVQKIFEEDWKGLVYDRRYVAVALGQVEKDEGTISNWLKDNKQFFTFSSPVDNGGKFAVTHYRVLQRGATNTLVEARLDTGRKNQIRVHLSDLGNPILGDRKYAPDDAVAAFSRLCLHAYRLYFIHPVTGEHLMFDTPVPNKFLSAL
ncbi:MAG: RluA family pseudouridine synthase [Prevotellaceae bacterium]|nr:RluA family pseudouridine synthase [Prevotellaceae bacterium]